MKLGHCTNNLPSQSIMGLCTCMSLLLFLQGALSFTVQTQTKRQSTPVSTVALSSVPGSIIKTAQKLGGPTTAAIAATAVLGTAGVKLILDKPSRKYEDGSVAREYDAWTQDGILEYYWGEHIHLGYYNQQE